MGNLGSQTKFSKNLQILNTIEHIIFDLNNDNIIASVELILKYFNEKYSYSFNFIICSTLFSYFVSQGHYQICLEYLRALELKENEIYNNLHNNVINVFISYLNHTYYTQESNYLYGKMIEQEIIQPKILGNKRNLYFAHYLSEEEYKKIEDIKPYQNFNENIKELKKNDWELHKKYVKEGVNPNKIAKIIRNDEFEKLQEISSQTNFDFNQTIEPSLYERYSFINQNNVTLIDYAAFFSSVQCFKYLLMNGAKVENTGKYAVAGGNEEIIHLCEQHHSSFKDAYKAAIEFHRNEIFYYLYENKIEKINNLGELGNICVSYYNYEILSFLEREWMKVNKVLIIKSIETGNTFLAQYFHEKNLISINFFETSIIFENKELFDYLIKENIINIHGKSVSIIN